MFEILLAVASFILWCTVGYFINIWTELRRYEGLNISEDEMMNALVYSAWFPLFLLRLCAERFIEWHRNKINK